MKQILRGSSLLICMLMFFSESAIPQSPAGAAAGQPGIGDDYVIGVDDILSIYVWKEPDFSIKEIAVRSDGKISIPLINDIQAGGLTTKDLGQSITEKLKKYVTTPEVTVAVLKSHSRSVSIVGQVNKPGIYPVGGPITVLELLARAGGITEFAKQKSIKIIRKDESRSEQFLFNYKEAIRGVNLKQNIDLKAGDVVLVP